MGRARTITAWVMLVVAGILTPLAVVGHWGQRTLIDSKRYIETVQPLANDPHIQQAVTERVTNRIFSTIDVEAAIKQLLPDQLDPLAAPVANAVQRYAHDVVAEVLASQQFQTLWREINVAAQKVLVIALQGKENGALQVSGNEVVLDLEPVFNAVKQRLVDRGLTFLQNVQPPPAAQRQVVLVKSDDLEQLQHIYSLTNPIAKYLIWLVVLLYIAAVALARQHRRMLLRVGVALILGMLVLGAALAYARASVTSTPDSTLSAAILAFYVTLTRYLRNAIWAIAALGLVLALGAWFAGPSRAAVAMRSGWSSLMGGTAARTAGAEGAGGAFGTVAAWTRQHRAAVVVGVLIIATGSLFLHGTASAATVLWTALITLVVVGLVEFVAALAPRSSA